MKQKKGLSAVSVILGIIMVLYIAALAMPHMDYKASERVPTGVGDETELVVKDASMSILGFVGFPNSSKENAIKKQVQEKFDAEYTINGATNGPVLLILFGILGAISAFLLRKKLIGGIVPILWAIGGVIVYFTNPYVMLGALDYYVQLALLIVVGVLAIVVVAARVPDAIATRKQIKMEIRITKERERGMQQKREAALKSK